MTYKIKKYNVTSTGMAYSFEIKAKNKKEAIEKYKKMFEKKLTGEEEVFVE